MSKVFGLKIRLKVDAAVHLLSERRGSGTATLNTVISSRNNDVRKSLRLKLWSKTKVLGPIA